MTLRRRVKRIGGSLGILIPRDFAEAMGVTDSSEVRLTLVGRQVVVEPVQDTLDDAAFRRALERCCGGIREPSSILPLMIAASGIPASVDGSYPLPIARASSSNRAACAPTPSRPA